MEEFYNEKFRNFREKAQKILNDKQYSFDSRKYKNNISELLEELYISQIELELQNEELKSAQLQLENEKQRFEDLYHNAPIGYFQLNEKGKIIDFNKKSAELLSVPPHILKNKPFIAFIQKEYVYNFHLHLNKIFAQTDEDEIEIEIAIRDANKKIRYLRLKSNALHDKSSNRTYCRTIAEDITERKKDREKIDGLNRRLEASMSAGNMAWWELELPSGKVTFNDNKALMLNRNPADFEYYPDFMDLVHPNDYEKTMEAFRQHLHGEKDVYECEYRIKAKNGEYLWFYDIGKIIFKQEKNIKLTGIVTNITERKRTEQIVKDSEKKIKESEENLKEIINNVPLAVFVHREGKIILVNHYAEKYTGYTKQELLSMFVTDIDKQAIARNDAEKIWKQVPKGKQFKLETTHQRKDGSEYPAEIHFTGIMYHNEPAIIAIVQDITERKRAENLLRELNATKDKFLNIIAHDLKNPFNSILTFSEMLSRNIEKYDKERMKSLIDTVYSSAKNTYKLLENLLEWSRSQTGKINFNPEKTKLRNVVIEMTGVVENQAKNKQITVENQVPDEFMVYADRNMLSTIIRNLISNAVKFTHRNGKVCINAEQKDEQIVVRVSDTGIGMSTEKQKKLFNISEKIQMRGTENEAGTGIGLILCKEFVEKHSGKIWIESAEGKGSIFYFTLKKAD